MLKRATSFALVVSLSGAVACSDSTNPLAGRGQNVMLSFASQAGTGPIAGSVAGSAGMGLLAAGDSLVQTDGNGNTLVIYSIEVLLREIELKRANTSDCDSIASSDACEKFEVGATLVDVPLAGGAAAAITIAVDSGTYTEVEFDVHKLGGDSVDNAFAATHPNWPANVSIRVTGRYNGTAFTYTTGLDQEQEVQFVPPLVIDASGSTTNLTVRFDPATWFRNGTTLIDPASANQGGANVSLVENNIKNSIEAFHDHDRDGDEN